MAAEEVTAGGEGKGPDLSRLAAREAPPPKAKRFYREVTVEMVDGAHRVLLDNRPVKTPLRRILETPSPSLAEAIAAEWQAQGDTIDPRTMPMTRLAATALDRVADERAAIIETLLAYMGTDLLCYRATAPAELRNRQQTVWQPVLDWLAAHHGIELAVTAGIVPVEQPQSARAGAERLLAALSIDHLTAAQAAIAATGSFALGSALVKKRLSAAEAIAAAHLDETYQNEQWGEDAEALARRQLTAADIEAAARYVDLIGP